MTNIHAYTELGINNPAYISINRREGELLEITVRTRGESLGSTIKLTYEQACNLVNDFGSYLTDLETRCGSHKEAK